MIYGTGFALHKEVSGEDDPSWQGCSFQDPFPWDAGTSLPALQPWPDTFIPKSPGSKWARQEFGPVWILLGAFGVMVWSEVVQGSQ